MGEEICPHGYSNNDDGIDEGLLDYEDSHFGQMKLFTDADTMVRAYAVILCSVTVFTRWFIYFSL
jgi:hypothetical protein